MSERRRNTLFFEKFIHCFDTKNLDHNKKCYKQFQKDMDSSNPITLNENNIGGFQYYDELSLCYFEPHKYIFSNEDQKTYNRLKIYYKCNQYF